MFIYHTDQDNIITSVNRAFVVFARDNWRSDFDPAHLLGKPLFSQISDITCRHIYLILLERIKKNRRAFTVAFRCDSPAMRRYMEMTITPDRGGVIEWSSKILKEQLRDPLAVLDATQERSKNFLFMCSWCKKCKISEWITLKSPTLSIDEWIEPEDMMTILSGSGSPRFPEISHTVCPDCHQVLLEEIKNFS